MLYQTHHLPLFQLHPSTTPQLHLYLLLFFFVFSGNQSTHNPPVQNVVASCDDFFVDDLLDFSLLENEEPDQHNDGTASVSPQNKNQEIYNFSPSLNNDNFSSELTVPAEEVADLEWLSHFVEDSFSEHALSFPVAATESKETAPEPGNAGFTFKTPVPGRARSKRTRTGVRVWPQRSPSFTDTSSTSTTSSSSSSSPASPLLICAAATKGPDARPKKRWAAEGGGASRRCSHCGVQKTPQWRTGPLGAKTLCNACGVRFKSGRLLPEYRPACSPTYSSELHSNHHRKVLEMRRKKEESDGPVSGSGSSPSVLGV